MEPFDADEGGELEQIIARGDYRESLVAIRDYLAHELDGHRCKTCAMSQLKTGDTAALVLRLQKVLEELEAIPDPEEDDGRPTLASVREIAGGSAAPSVQKPPPVGGAGTREQGA